MRRAAEAMSQRVNAASPGDARSCQESVVRRAWKKGDHLHVLESIQGDPSGFKVQNRVVIF